MTQEQELIERITRWNCDEAGTFSGADTGKYVLSTDFDDVANELSRERAARERIARKLERARSRHTPNPDSKPPTDEQIASAICETDYKYFGDYEMSDGQRDAVEVLISASQHMTEMRAEISTLRQQLKKAREVKPLEWIGFESDAYEIKVSGDGIASLYSYATRDEDGEPVCMKSGFLTLVSIDDLKNIAQADYQRRYNAMSQEGE